MAFPDMNELCEKQKTFQFRMENYGNISENIKENSKMYIQFDRRCNGKINPFMHNVVKWSNIL